MAEPIIPTPVPGKPLSEINAGNPKPAAVPIVAGSGEPTPPVLNPAAPVVPDPAEVQRLADEAALAVQDAADARIAELRAKAPETLTPEEKVELDAAPPLEEETDFWEDVDALRGKPLAINWAEQKDPSTGELIDPMSPAGALIRERAIAAEAVAEFDAHLEKADPRAYAYILHRQAGGTDEDFFANKTISLPDYETFTSSVDLQQKVYRDDLLRKGVSEKQVKLLVDQAVKDKDIFELADKAYKDQEAGQKKELDAIAAKLQAEQAGYEQKVASLNSLLQKEVATNAAMKFIIPDAKKPEFMQFVQNTIQHADGKFFVVQELDAGTLPRVLEGLYLQHVQGDITGLVQRTARTLNTKRLRTSVARTHAPAAGAAPPGSGKKTLGEI